jgi:hypothetical protein
VRQAALQLGPQLVGRVDPDRGIVNDQAMIRRQRNGAIE